MKIPFLLTETVKISSLDILVYAYLKRECVNANKKSDVYLKDFDDLIKFKKTFDANFNDTLAVNTEGLQEREGKQF